MNKIPFQTFKDLRNWFGDRGDEIQELWVKDWLVIYDLLYVQWDESAPNIFKAEEPSDCVSYAWKSWNVEDDDYHLFKNVQKVAEMMGRDEQIKRKRKNRMMTHEDFRNRTVGMVTKSLAEALSDLNDLTSKFNDSLTCQEFSALLISFAVKTLLDEAPDEMSGLSVVFRALTEVITVRAARDRG